MKKLLVLLPAGKVFDQLFTRAIKPVCHELNLEIANPPIHLNNQPVMEQVQRMIMDADWVLGDVSAANGSVLYAIGFATALGKSILLTTVAAEDFPLNLSYHQPIVHTGHPEILTFELKGRLRSILAATEAKDNVIGATVADPHATAREEFQSIFGEILKAHQHNHTGPLYKENDTTFVLENNDMDLALVQDLARHARSLNMRLKLL